MNNEALSNQWKVLINALIVHPVREDDKRSPVQSKASIAGVRAKKQIAEEKTQRVLDCIASHQGCTRVQICFHTRLREYTVSDRIKILSISGAIVPVKKEGKTLWKISDSRPRQRRSGSDAGSSQHPRR